MTVNGVIAVTLRYCTEFGKPAFQHITVSICGGIYARLLYFVARVRCSCKESSRLLCYLLMSFLSICLSAGLLTQNVVEYFQKFWQVAGLEIKNSLLHFGFK